MKVQDIIKLVCVFVGEKELHEKLKTDESLSEREQEKLDRMIRCFNLVNQEIASDFLPFLAKEEVSGNIINFEMLAKRVVQIYEVRNHFGKSLRFKVFTNFVEVDGNPRTIVYSFLPSKLSLYDEVECAYGLSERIYAYGIASEYLLIDGASDDAEIWENRYKESLFMLSRKKGEHVLPKRRWC